MVKYMKPRLLQFTSKHCMIWEHFHVTAQILDKGITTLEIYKASLKVCRQKLF